MVSTKIKDWTNFSKRNKIKTVRTKLTRAFKVTWKKYWSWSMLINWKVQLIYLILRLSKCRKLSLSSFIIAFCSNFKTHVKYIILFFLKMCLNGITSESLWVSESLKSLLESLESYRNPWNLVRTPGISLESLESYCNP